MSRALARVFPYLLLFPAVLPLVYFGGLLYPYLAPKTLLFRADAILAAAVFVALVLSGRSFYVSRLRSPSAWIPVALLAVAYISSVFGVDFYHSFWSIFDRGDGLLTFSAVVTFFYLTLLYADTAFITRLIKIVVFSASLVALVAVLQWLQAVSGMNFPLVPVSAGRIGSTLGNAAYLASYLGMTLFITLAIVPSLRGRWRTAAFAGAVLQLLAIIATATRGSLLALVIAAFVGLVYTAWKGSASYRTYARVGVVAVVLLAGLFLAFRAQLAAVPFAPIARVASISLSDATVESRLFIWRNVLAEPFAHPLGVGAEHIETLFDRFYDPTAIVEQWFDRTHNAFLDYFVQYGVVGLILYLALIGVFVRESFRLTLSSIPDEVRRGRLFLLLALVYVVQNFFVFDTVVTLWLLLVLIATLIASRDTGKQSVIVMRRLPAFVPVGAGVLIALLIVPVSLMPLRANLLLADGYLYQLTDVRREIAAVEKGYALGTYADLEYGYQLYEMYTDRQMTRLSGEGRVLAFRLARDILAKNFEKYPYDARTAMYYAHVLDVAPKGDEPDEELLRAVIERAIELSPKRIQSRYLLANISIRKGDAQPAGSTARKAFYDEAIRGLNEYADLVPKFAEPRYIIATLYLTLGENVVAAQWAEEGRAVYRSDENTARRAARYYVVVGDWENARYFLKEVVDAKPTDYPFMYDLAKAEFLSDNVERAREIVAELRQKAPDLLKTDPAFLEAIGE